MSRRRPRSGFTILELMVTMAIASALLALGAGMFLKLGRRTALTQAIADVNLLITKARNASSRVPAELVADPKEGYVFAKVEEVLQELHFESRPTEEGPVVPLGIDGRDCQVAGGDVVADGGRVGGGVRLNNGSIQCGNFAAYDVDQGLSAEAWIRPAAAATCDVVSKGRVLLVRLSPAGPTASRLTVKLRVRDAEKGAQENLEATVNVPIVRAGEWTGILVSYDGRELVVATDEGYGPVVRLRQAETRPVAVDAEAPLAFGAGLDGWIDDCRFGGIRAAEPVRLPEGLAVAEPKRIRFVNGRLDPATHTAGGESLTLRGEKTLTTFQIGPAGTVLSVEETPLPDPAAPGGDGKSGGGKPVDGKGGQGGGGKK